MLIAMWALSPVSSLNWITCLTLSHYHEDGCGFFFFSISRQHCLNTDRLRLSSAALFDNLRLNHETLNMRSEYAQLNCCSFVGRNSVVGACDWHSVMMMEGNKWPKSVYLSSISYSQPPPHHCWVHTQAHKQNTPTSALFTQTKEQILPIHLGYRHYPTIYIIRPTRCIFMHHWLRQASPRRHHFETKTSPEWLDFTVSACAMWNLDKAGFQLLLTDTNNRCQLHEWEWNEVLSDKALPLVSWTAMGTIYTSMFSNNRPLW